MRQREVNGGVRLFPLGAGGGGVGGGCGGGANLGGVGWGEGSFQSFPIPCIQVQLARVSCIIVGGESDLLFTDY